MFSHISKFKRKAQEKYIKHIPSIPWWALPISPGLHPVALSLVFFFLLMSKLSLGNHTMITRTIGTFTVYPFNRHRAAETSYKFPCLVYITFFKISARKLMPKIPSRIFTELRKNLCMFC